MSNYVIQKQTQSDIDREADERVDVGDPDYVIASHIDKETIYTLFAPTNFTDQSKVGLPTDSSDRRLVATRDDKCVAILRYSLGPHFVNLQTKRKHVPKNGIFIGYIEVHEDFRKQGEARKILSALKQLEGNITVMGFATNQKSAKLFHHPNWKNFPKVAHKVCFSNEYIEEHWFSTPLKDVIQRRPNIKDMEF